MLRKQTAKILMPAVLAVAMLIPASAVAAPGPPPPRMDGVSMKPFAGGVAIPTQMAFSGKRVFVTGAAEGRMKGGLFAVDRRSKKAVRVPGTVKSAFGVAARHGRVYVSSGRRVIAYSGYDGKRFRRSRTIFNGGRKFNGFGGMAIGPDNRLYAGVTLNQKFDNTADPGRFGNSVVSMGLGGRKVKVVSTGLRQPWMMTFAKGIRDPFVSVLGQDLPLNNGAPDLIVKAKPKSNFGFPECSWLDEAACSGFTRPFLKLEAQPGPEDSLGQQSPMGIAARGNRLFVALFGGTAEAGPQVMTVRTDGTGMEPLITGFVAPVLSVAVHQGRIYAGDLTGTIWSTRLG